MLQAGTNRAFFLRRKVDFDRLREPGGSGGLRRGIGRAARHAQTRLIADGEVVDIGGRPSAEAGVSIEQQAFTVSPASQGIPTDDPPQQAPGAAQDGPCQHVPWVVRPHVQARDAHQQRARVEQAHRPNAGVEVPGDERRHQKGLAAMPARA